MIKENKRFQINNMISLTSIDLKRPQLTSKEVTNENIRSPKNKNKNNLKSGYVHKIIEINDKYLDEFLHINTF